MSSTHADQLVEEYLRRLDAALASLPADQRAEILDEVSNHIADERASMAQPTEADVLNLLDRVGEPASVAAAAVDGAPSLVLQPARRIGVIEVLALVLTPFIWPVGVILLWLSPAWNTRDKLIGTLVPPGGYLMVIWLPSLLLFNAVSTCSFSSGPDGSSQQTCTGLAAQPEWIQVLVGIGVLLGTVLLLILPILTAIYMGWRLRRWSAQQAG